VKDKKDGSVGVVEYRKIGVLEWWSIGVLVEPTSQPQSSLVPLLHHSSTPLLPFYFLC
jgi:hypothetical protein